MSDLIAEKTQARPNPRQEEAAKAKGASLRKTRTIAGTRGLAGLVALALVWEFAPRVGLVDAYSIPPLHVVLQEWWSMTTSGELWRHVSASLTRSVIGFALAIATAIPLGASIAWYRPVREFFTPVLELFRNTAALAILPVFMLILGIGETSKIAIVLYACFFPILLSTIAGVATVDPQLLRSARVLGLSPVTTFRKVVFPAAVPTIFTGIRISGAAAILVLIAAEMIGATAGLGFLINYAQFNFLIPKMYAAILTTSLIGVAVNYGLVALERRFSQWRAI
ncbi:ABC transporter permease subunit [Aeromicrobium sp. 636]|uniref:ABC transporter permease n=1 Tax=Aeromicrobium senzhongii TaxID=2663859 RepID=A0A8I0JZS8_9ACTN|nr:MULTISPECIES: ABC transporter permease [Aeromicrobium]MBC9225606.1 ABC transporter permease [Aeromicrobium senzhongii]MCQ3997715.1 ABC transporter permease subunit [Aeromicrobium sp. 636]